MAGAGNAEAFAAAVDAAVDASAAHAPRGPAVLVPDKARIPRARLLQERRAAWARQGVSRCFLPA